MAYDQTRLDDYVDVAERIRIFRDRHPDGSLQPFNPAEPFRIIDVDGQTFITYTAAAYRTPDDHLPGIAVAWEPFPGKTPYTKDSELQNVESAAWGRAIVAALAADTKKVASLDEVRARREARDTGHPSTVETPVKPRQQPATDNQERALFAMSKKLDRLPPAKGTLTKAEAGTLIEQLQNEIDNRKDQEEPF